MRGFVILGVMFFVLVSVFAGSVSAFISCGNSNQIMFRISSETNAHVQTNADNHPTTYGWEICFDDYFQGTGGAGTDEILMINSPTNAHADTLLGIYQTPVQYGDLSCALVSGDCVGQQSIIVSLSAQTNAHVSLSNLYGWSLCCSSTTGIPPICDYGGPNDCEPENGENEYNCPTDCGTSGPSCGDGSCNGVETCSSCEADCGVCGGSYCGDGTCDADEDAASCPADCDDGGNGGGGGEGWCDAHPDDATTCGNYGNSDLCYNDCNNVGDDIEAHGFDDDGFILNSWCEWNVDSCDFAYTTVTGTECSVEYNDDPDCGPDDTTRIVSVTVTSDEDDDCGTGCTLIENEDGTWSGTCPMEIACPRVLLLPFFGWINFIVSFVSVFFVYVLLRRR